MVNVNYIKLKAYEYSYHIINKDLGYNLYNARKIFKKYFHYVQMYVNAAYKLNILDIAYNQLSAIKIYMSNQILRKLHDIHVKTIEKLENSRNMHMLDTFKQSSFENMERSIKLTEDIFSWVKSYKFNYLNWNEFYSDMKEMSSMLDDILRKIEMQ